MLNHLIETLQLADGTRRCRSPAIDPVPSEEAPGPVLPPVAGAVPADERPAVLALRVGDVVLEKSLLMPHGQNTVLIRYRLLAARAPVRLTLEPLLDMRPHDSAVAARRAAAYCLTRGSGRIRDRAVGPVAAAVAPARRGRRRRDRRRASGDVEVRYRLEQARGYDWRGVLRSAGTPGE